MGLCGGDAAFTDPAARARSEQIDRDLKQEKRAFQNEQKLLLLGAGESGKSTIVKQMRIIHTQGFSSQEKDQMKGSIYSNVHDSSKALAHAATDLGIEIGCQDSASFMLGFSEKYSASEYPPEFFDHAQALWADAGIKATYERRNEFQLNDSADYFFNELPRLRDPSYVPTDQDAVRLRVLTTGVFETKFSVSEVQFHMFDVGGQRSERRKWIQCFGDVTAIMFVAACSGYDMVLREDNSQNRLTEALELFESIWSNRWLEKVSVILFLNKTDLLEEKVPKSPISKFFPDYTGGANIEEAKKFIKEKFSEIGTGYEEKRVYPHFTCAIDTGNVKRVFNACRDIIQNLHLQHFGLA